MILNHAPPKLRGYSRETTIAEKFEAMVKLGLVNSRMKDFFNIWLLSRQFDFDGATLAEAIQRTFSNRGTVITAKPTAFSAEFATHAGKVSQWQALVRKLRWEGESDFDVSITTSGSCTRRTPVSWAVAQCGAMD